jgi:hypothetical protein
VRRLGARFRLLTWVMLLERPGIVITASTKLKMKLLELTEGLGAGLNLLAAGAGLLLTRAAGYCCGLVIASV